MMILNAPLWADFKVFARAQLATQDIDPTYPLLRDVYRGLDERTALWRTLLFVATYHLGSAEALWAVIPEPHHGAATGIAALLARMNLPTGTERRGFRGAPLLLAHHITALVNTLMVDQLLSFKTLLSSWSPRDAWNQARSTYETLPHAGPWSSYKLADLLKNVHGFDMEATDLGIGGGGENAGPIPGLVRLTGLNWRDAATNVDLHWKLLEHARNEGVPFGGLDQLETALCDFNSLSKGSYYVGHDIDDQMEKLRGLAPKWWEARARIFDARLLGERGGWFGVRRHLKRVYIDEYRNVFLGGADMRTDE